MSRYNALFKCIEVRKPITIMEIGTWNGVHACKMIALAKQQNPDYYITYYGFDLFKNKTDVIKRLDSFPVSDLEYYLIQGNTKDTLPEFFCGRQIDFIFLNGDHSLETIRYDWMNIQRFIRPSTWIVLDNYYEDSELSLQYGCRALIDNLDEHKYNVQKLDPVDKVNGGTRMVLVEGIF